MLAIGLRLGLFLQKPNLCFEFPKVSGGIFLGLASLGVYTG